MKTVQLMKGDKIIHKEKKCFSQEKDRVVNKEAVNFHIAAPFDWQRLTCICLSVLSFLLGKTGVLYR